MAGGKPTVEMVMRRELIPNPLRTAGYRQGGHHRGKIGQRFAHAHHHDVADPGRRGQKVLELQHFFEDFATGEIAHHTVKAAGAEGTAHGATDLGTDTDGVMLAVVAQQHALDLLAIGQFQQQLFGAVVGLAVDGDARGPDLESVAQLVP